MGIGVIFTTYNLDFVSLIVLIKVEKCIEIRNLEITGARMVVSRVDNLKVVRMDMLWKNIFKTSRVWH